MKSLETEIKISDFNLSVNNPNSERKSNYFLYTFGFPFIILIFVAAGFFGSNFLNVKEKQSDVNLKQETKGGQIKNAGKFNILSSNDLLGVKDTVYTDKDCWLELRIDQQMLYQHWRNGSIVKYPVSSGNNKGGDPEALESRPGLFAIFIKEEHHQSSQFASANMYHFMPFNQGIGFHSIDGTGYYAHLGVRPSSHGCIRMRHEDAKKLYGDCELGTLVLATKGVSARAIAFSPEGFENKREYTKDEYKKMLAGNLFNLMNKRYYLEEREKFVIDPKIIPVSGIYISYDVEVPKKQLMPRSFIVYSEKSDKTNYSDSREILSEENSKIIDLNNLDTGEVQKETKQGKVMTVSSTDDMVKKYFNNPIGVLPYFGPKR